MSVLARASGSRIAALLEECGEIPAFIRIRGPEAGLVMVRGRAGGDGAPFNLGEMSVTRCTVRTDSGLIGHAYVAGREERQDELAALVDALMQDPDRAPLVREKLIDPLAQHQQAERDAVAGKAAATKVQFFAMQTMRT